jgi:hypothetical protein
MKRSMLLLIVVFASVAILQDCNPFRGKRNGADASPITISDEKIHYREKPDGFQPVDKSNTAIYADETNQVAQLIIVENCPQLPCTVDLTPGNSSGQYWSANVLDQEGNPIDIIKADASKVTVTDQIVGEQFMRDQPDATEGKGYYHDPPGSSGAHNVRIGSVQVTVGTSAPQPLQCPQTNCKLIAKYCEQGWVPNDKDHYKCNKKVIAARLNEFGSIRVRMCQL